MKSDNNPLLAVRAGKTVLKRSGKVDEYPEHILVISVLPGLSGLKVLDPAGSEHELNEKVLRSNYRNITGGQAKKLIAEHWSDVKIA